MQLANEEGKASINQFNQATFCPSRFVVVYRFRAFYVAIVRPSKFLFVSFFGVAFRVVARSFRDVPWRIMYIVAMSFKYARAAVKESPCRCSSFFSTSCLFPSFLPCLLPFFLPASLPYVWVSQKFHVSFYPLRSYANEYDK
ncbi:hypothetical protein VTL71DRAFT_8159 [Oculimacula yallundae]|uniref:Transmembrane protein n=1 Tax=Oculimacula yallundae TaxID=86028 RepID=A0ABR4CWR7_9HELO